MNQEDKYCTGCNVVKSRDSFNKNTGTRDGLTTRCRLCIKIQRNKWISELGNYIACLYLHLKYKAKERNIDVKITDEDILDLYEKQGRRCALTGITLTHVRDDPDHKVGDRYFYNISVDRVNSNGIYEKGNIQLICSMLNQIKWDIPNDLLIKACKQLVRHNNVTGLKHIAGDPLFSQVSPTNPSPTIPIVKMPT